LNLIFLFTGHCFGDFVFQSGEMANEKLESKKTFFKHCAIYGTSLFFVTVFFGNVFQVILFSSVIALTHLAIDLGRVFLEKRLAPNNRKGIFSLFILDQFLHLITLALFAAALPEPNFIGNHIRGLFHTYFHETTALNLSLIIFVYVLCSFPAGVFIKKLFILWGFQKAEVGVESGYIIGILERMCVLTLALLGQYTAISFVIAAKSLARMEQFKQPDFAEKYLVGTLLSFLIALLSGIAITHLIN